MSLHNFLATCLGYADPEFQERHVSLSAVDEFGAPHATFSPKVNDLSKMRRAEKQRKQAIKAVEEVAREYGASYEVKDAAVQVLTHKLCDAPTPHEAQKSKYDLAARTLFELMAGGGAAAAEPPAHAHTMDNDKSIFFSSFFFIFPFTSSHLFAAYADALKTGMLEAAAAAAASASTRSTAAAARSSSSTTAAHGGGVGKQLEDDRLGQLAAARQAGQARRR